MLKARFFFLILCLLPLLAGAQSLTVEAPQSVDLSERYFRLQYKVGSADAEDFRGPSLDGFEKLSGPNVSTSSSFQMVNGQTSRSSSTTYTYILAPKREGRFTLQPATVSVGGVTIRSKSVTIAVTGSGKPKASGATQADDEPQRVQQAGERIADRDLFVTLTPSRSRVFEQEAVLLTYRVHARLGVGLTNVGLSRKPDFKGLVSQEIPTTSVQSTVERIGGADYRTATVLQYVIFPQQAGRLTIPGLTFDCTVAQQRHFIDELDAFFNGGGLMGVKVQRSAPVLTIDVQALPERPAGFSGGVGQFCFRGRLLSAQARTNEVGTYRLTLSGTGNLKLISAPSVAFPADFDTYDPKSADSTSVTAEGTQGTVTYDYVFVPRNVGTYTIPAVSMVVFNPSSGRYETLTSEPVTLQVEQGQRSRADAEREILLRQSDIRPLRLGAAKPAVFWFGTWRFFAALAGLLLVWAVAGVVLRRFVRQRADVGGRRRRKAAGVARQRLAEARRLETDGGDAFYAAVSQALHTYLQHRFGVAQGEISEAFVVQRLTDEGAGEEVAHRFADVLSRCQYARFAPVAAGGAAALLADAEAAVDGVEAALAGTAKSVPLKALALVLMAWVSVSLPVAAQKSLGDSLYAAADYVGATRAYEAVDGQPSADVCYNLGNALFRQNLYSRAVLAYERALRLDPAASDVRHNLALCRTKLADQFGEPEEMFFRPLFRSLRDRFTADGWGCCGLLWLALGLTAVLVFRFSQRLWVRKTGFGTAAVALLLTLLCFALATVQRWCFATEQRAVVMQSVELRDGATPTAHALRELHAGTAVGVETTAKGWLRVELPDGSLGWLPAESCELVAQ